MRSDAGRSRTPSPLHEVRRSPDLVREAGRSLIRGPDRAGALAFILMFGWVSVSPGCAVLYLVSSFSGPTDIVGESSRYLELASGSFAGAAISFLWLRLRRGGIDWLHCLATGCRTRRPPARRTGR